MDNTVFQQPTGKKKKKECNFCWFLEKQFIYAVNLEGKKSTYPLSTKRQSSEHLFLIFDFSRVSFFFFFFFFSKWKCCFFYYYYYFLTFILFYWYLIYAINKSVFFSLRNFKVSVKMLKIILFSLLTVISRIIYSHK